MKLFKNKIKNRKLLSILTLSLFFLLISFGISFAQTGGNMTGWAWGAVDSNHDGSYTPGVDGGIGWLSFSCADLAGQCSASNYGISLDASTGLLSGYARSSSMGWVTFNASDLADCPSALTSELSCAAQVDLMTGTVTGWARACSVFVFNCTGSLNPNRGGWDGWIELSGINHTSPGFSNPNISGVTFDIATNSFFGFAWGGNDSTGSNDIGWISFGGYDPTGCLTVSTHCPPRGDVYVGANPTTLTTSITIPSSGSTSVFWQPYASDASCSTKTYEGPITLNTVTGVLDHLAVDTGTSQWDHLVAQPVDMLDATAGLAGVATTITNPSSTDILEVRYEMTCANDLGLTNTSSATVFVLPSNPSNNGSPVATLYVNNIAPTYSMLYGAPAFPLSFTASVPAPTAANHATTTSCTLTSNSNITHSGSGWTPAGALGSTYSTPIVITYTPPTIASYSVPNIDPLDIPVGASSTVGGTPVTFTINCIDSDGLTATSTGTVVRYGPNPTLTYHIIPSTFLVPSASTAVTAVDGHVKLGWVPTDLVSCTNNSAPVTPWPTFPTGTPLWSTPGTNPALYDMTTTDPLLLLPAGVSTTFSLKCIDVLNNPHIYPITLSPATAPGTPGNPTFEEF